MLRIRSRRSAAPWLITPALLLAGIVGGSPAHAAQATAQGARAAQDVRIASSQIALSRDDAELTLELEGRQPVRIALRGGVIEIDGERAGTYARGDALDRAWRALLNDAMEASGRDLAALLSGWDAPSGAAGARVSETLTAALSGARSNVNVAQSAAASAAAPAQDTVERLNERIRELEERVRSSGGADIAAAELRREIEREVRARLRSELRSQARAGSQWTRPFRHVGRGMAGIVSTVATYLVLVLLGFAAVFFGRKYLEGVADTARHATLRSGLVGVAASFLVLPMFILGIIALAISVVGIPLLLVWVPLFPVAVIVGALFGYLAVAHAAGEALAERRFYGGDWFRLGNSYYFVLTGLGLLSALYLAAHVVQMGGPWLGFLHGLLMFLAVILTWAAFSIGLGAVLLSRAGTQPLVAPPAAEPEPTPGIFEEEANV